MAGTITFSGLSSGLDTSSWVDALVSVRQTTITSLQNDQQVKQQLLSVVNNIKSYFTSFQNCLQKITDSQFGIPSIDLFMQNLAKSSNANIVTATATTEAARQTYDVFVEQLATATKASSGYVQRDTKNATLDTKLGDLGVNNGNITVNSQSFRISTDDTLKDLIKKFSDIGVIASFNEKDSKFTVSCAINDLDDSSTGLKTALKLQNKNVTGLKSGSIVYADRDTQLVALTPSGKNLFGDIKINDREYNISYEIASYSPIIEIEDIRGIKTDISTVGKFLDFLKNTVGAEEADIDDHGNLVIKGAVIESVAGGSDIVDILKLGEIKERTVMRSNNLTYEQQHAASLTTTLAQLGISRFQTLSINGRAIPNIGITSNLQAVKTALGGAGIDFDIDENGIITIDTHGATISGTIINALNLTADKSGTVYTSSAHNVTYKADKDTLLSTLGVTNTMTYTAYDSLGNAITGTLNNNGGLTIEGFINKLRGNGLDASFDEESHTIRINDGYITGDVATALGMSTGTVTHQEFADRDTTLEQLGATGNTTLSINGGAAQTFGKNQKISDVITALETAGGTVSFRDGVMTVTDITVTGSTAALLGFEATTQGTSVTSGALSVITGASSTSSSQIGEITDHNISMSSKIGDITGTTNNYSLYISPANTDTIVIPTTLTVTKDSTLQDVADKISAAGGSLTINDDNTITIEGVRLGTSSTLPTALGLTVTGRGTQLNRMNVSHVYVGGLTSVVEGGNTLEDLGATGNTTLSINGGTAVSYAKTTSIDTILGAIRTAGGTARIEDGIVTVEGVNLSGTVLPLLNLQAVSDGTSITSGELKVVTSNTSTSSAVLTPRITVNANEATTTLSNLTGASASTSYQLSINGGANKNYTGATLLSTIKSDIVSAGGTMSVDEETGIITVEGVRLSGSAVAAMGLTATDQRTSISSVSAITLDQSFLINSSTTFTQLAVSDSAARSYAIYDNYGNVIAATSTTGTAGSTKNIGDWLSAINTAMNTYYGTTGTTYATVNNGVISIDGGYVSGNLPNNIGMDSQSTVSGTQLSGSTAQYQTESRFTGTVSEQLIPAGAKRVSELSNSSSLYSGTYLISSAADLQQLATLSNSSSVYIGATFILTNDIDMASSTFTGIATQATSVFAGAFYGNGYEIKNINLTENGIFGNVLNATIRDLGVSNVSANITSTTGSSGILADSVGNSTIENCYVDGSMTSNVSVSGFIGSVTNHSTVNNCYTSVNINSTWGVTVGFINTLDSSTVTNCYSTGNIQTTMATAAGFVYHMISGDITNCYSTGNVNSTATGGSVRLGGFVQYGSGTISNCYSTGDVTSDHPAPTIGSFATETNNITFNNCVYNNEVGPADGGTDAGVAGIQGYSHAAILLDNSLPHLAGNNPYITRTAQTNTTLAQMGLVTNSDRTISVTIDDQTYTRSFAANATVQNVVDYLNGLTGIDARFENNQLRVMAPTSQNLSIGGKVAAELFGNSMSQNTVYSTKNTNDKIYYSVSGANLSNATRVGDLLGTNEGGTVSLLINDTTQINMTYDKDSTVGDIISDLAAYGINANVTSGIFTASSNDRISLFGDIGRALIGASGTTTYIDKSYVSGEHSYTTTPALSNDTKLSSLGIDSGNIQIVDSNGNLVNNIEIDNNRTLSQLASALSAYGFNLTVDTTNKKVTVSTNSSNKLVDGTSNAVSGLKLDTWTPTNSNITTGTTLAQMGMSNGTTLSVLLDGTTSMNISLGGSNTVGDVINSLAAIGINASVDANGKFTATSNQHSFRFSGDLGSFLTSGSAAGYVETNISYESSETLQVTSDVENLTNSTTIEDLLGVKGQDGILRLTFGDGEIINLTYAYNDTVQSVIDDLGNLGIEARISSGTFKAVCIDRTFVMSGNIGRKLEGDAPAYENSGTKFLSEDLSYQSSGKIKNTSTLHELGINSGNIYVVNADNNVVDSITLDETMTVQQVRNVMNSYGFNMSVNTTNGKVTISSNDGKKLTDGSSNLVSQFNLDTWTQTTSKLTAGTSLAQMGFTEGAELNVLLDNGTPTVLTFGATNTMQDVINSLAALDIDASINATNGAFTATSVKHAFVFSGDLGSFLTNGTTGYVNTDKGYITEDPLMKDVPVVTTTTPELTYSHSLATTDTVESMGFADGGVIRLILDGDTPYSLSFLATDTMQDIIDTLATYGMQTTVNATGQIEFRNDDHTFTVGGALGSWLAQGGTYTNKSTGYTSTPLEYNTTEHITTDTKLSTLGVSEGTLNIIKDGVLVDNINIDRDTTIGQLFNAVRVYDMTGRIITDGHGNTSIEFYNEGDNEIQDGTCDAISHLGFNIIRQGDYRSHLEYWDIGADEGILTEDTLLSSIGNPAYSSTGSFIFKLGTGADAEQHIVNISEDETVGSFLEKMRAEGVHAVLDNGVMKIDNSVYGINSISGTSQIAETMLFPLIGTLGDNVLSQNQYLYTYSTSSDALTYEEDVVYSVANYADKDTLMSTVNVTEGNMSLFVDGIKCTVTINATDSFSDVFSRITSSVAAATGNSVTVRAGFIDKNGSISTTNNTGIIGIEVVGDHKLVVGASNDTTNFATIANLKQDSTKLVSGERALYKVNINSKITEAGLFKKGDISEGDFSIGDATFTIDSNTTLNDLINQINKTDKSYASAYWDTLSGTLVLQSTLTGESLVNIEKGSSNFTEIMGFTSSSGGRDVLEVDRQTLGKNALVRINGTLVSATSNNITSDISKIKGLTINLKGLSQGASTQITVEQDDEGIYNAVNDIVDAYNTLMENVEKELSAEGAFPHDSMFKMMRNNLKKLMTQSLVGAGYHYKNLAAIGISTGAAQDSISTDVSSLIIDKDKFMQCLKDNSEAVKSLLCGTVSKQGVFLKAMDLVKGTLSNSGYLTSTEKTITKDINRIGKKVINLTEELAHYRTMLEKKFSSMERVISGLQTAYSGLLSA